MKNIKPSEYMVTIDLASQLSEKTGLSKDECAELLAEEIMKIINCLYKPVSYPSEFDKTFKENFLDLLA